MLNDDILKHVSVFLNLEEVYLFFGVNKCLHVLGNCVVQHRCKARKYTRNEIKHSYQAFLKYVRDFKRRNQYKKIQNRVRNDDTPIL